MEWNGNGIQIYCTAFIGQFHSVHGLNRHKTTTGIKIRVRETYTAASGIFTSPKRGCTRTVLVRTEYVRKKKVSRATL